MAFNLGLFGQGMGMGGNIAGSVVSMFNPIVGSAVSDTGSAISAFSKAYQDQQNLDREYDWSREQYYGSQAYNSEEAQKARDFNAQQAQMARDFLSSEGQKYRDYNSAEAKAQRDWEEAMWKKKNVYDSPASQLSRMRAAGINPAMLGSVGSPSGSVGQGASASASSPSTAEASSSPASFSSISNPPLFPSSNASLELAQSRLANAQASSIEEDTRLKQDTHDNEVVASGLRVQLLGSQVNLTDQQKENLKKDMEVADANIQKTNQEILQSKAYTTLLEKQGEERQKYLDTFDERFYKEMRAMDDAHKLSDAQIKEIWSKIKLNLSSANLIGVQSQGQFIQNALNGLELQLNDALYQYRYDAEKSQLSLSITESETNKSYSDKYNSDYGNVVQWVDITTSAIGKIFGGNVGLTKAIK